jgi:simple sugar transport system permease protein
MSSEFVINLIYSVIRMATPLIYATLAAIISKRAGTQNLAIEAIMLFSALMGALVSGYSQSLWLGLLGAIGAGVLISMFLAYMSMKLKANMTLTCISLNTLADGLTIFITYVLLGAKGNTLNMKTMVFPDIEIPVIKDIPVLGQILSGHNLLTYMAFLMVGIVWILLFKTVFGLRIRAVGEGAKSAESVGISVVRIQMGAFIMTGVIGALGGAFMSMGYLSWFSKGMVAGRGFIGVSASNLSAARPVLGMVVALLFGAIDAIAMTFQSFALPAELLQMLPYLATIIGLTLVSYIDKKKASLSGN